MKMTRKADLGGIVVGKRDGNLLFLCCTSFGMEMTYEQFSKSLCGIVDHIYDRIRELMGIY
jgi:hypothetical protein